MTLARITSSPLDAARCASAVAVPGVGGTALFIGTVRDSDGGKGVRELTYEAHPRAQVELERVLAEVGSTPGVLAVAAEHRTGTLAVGDLAVVVAVGAAHRGEAFTACRCLIDRIKAEVPIWKHQVFRDGSTEWVAACAHDLPENGAGAA